MSEALVNHGLTSKFNVLREPEAGMPGVRLLAVPDGSFHVGAPLVYASWLQSDPLLSSCPGEVQDHIRLGKWGRAGRAGLADVCPLSSESALACGEHRTPHFRSSPAMTRRTKFWGGLLGALFISHPGKQPPRSL